MSMDVKSDMDKLRRPTPASGFRAIVQQTLTPRQFVALPPDQRARVVRVDVVPPKIGQVGFGMMKVFIR